MRAQEERRTLVVTGQALVGLGGRIKQATVALGAGHSALVRVEAPHALGAGPAAALTKQQLIPLSRTGHHLPLEGSETTPSSGETVMRIN